MSVCAKFNWDVPPSMGHLVSNGLLGTDSRLEVIGTTNGNGNRMSCPCAGTIVTSQHTWTIPKLPNVQYQLAWNDAGSNYWMNIFADGSGTLRGTFFGAVVYTFAVGEIQVGDVFEYFAQLGGNSSFRKNGVVLHTQPTPVGGLHPATTFNFVAPDPLHFGDYTDNLIITNTCLVPAVPKTLNLQSLVNFVNVNTDLTLPTPQACDLNRFYVKSIGDNEITLLPVSGTIDGQSSVTVSGDGVGIELFFDGTNWYTLSTTNI